LHNKAVVSSRIFFRLLTKNWVNDHSRDNGLIGILLFLGLEQRLLHLEV
jgi:hypothetical protein